jgi:hypothetical protein
MTTISDIYRCPKCGSPDVRVSGSITVIPMADGVEPVGDTTWDGDAFASCQNEACQWTGKASELVEV